jgi:3-oxoacyl-[acyl-carrier protein] reductase
MRLEDTRFVVTGAAQGMGRHFAMRLAEAGGQVAAGDVNEAGLAALADEAASLRGKVHTRRLDVADEADVASFVGFAHGAMGGLNGLVNNAGILRDALLVKRDKTTGAIVRLTREQWQAVIDVNLTGATLMARDVAAKMAESGEKGAIVNISSIARHGNRGQSNYSAAKAALATNTRTWAVELAPFGIRVGAVAPGMIETPMTQGMNQKARDALVAAIPVGRIGVPEDIWLAVKFVIECDYFNGRTIDVDGGLSM